MSVIEKQYVLQSFLDKDPRWTQLATELKQGLHDLGKGMPAGAIVNALQQLANAIEKISGDAETSYRSLKEACVPGPKEIIRDEKDMVEVLLANMALLRGALQKLTEDLTDYAKGEHPEHSLEDAEKHYNDFVINWIKALGQAKALQKTYAIFAK